MGPPLFRNAVKDITQPQKGSKNLMGSAKTFPWECTSASFHAKAALCGEGTGSYPRRGHGEDALATLSPYPSPWGTPPVLYNPGKAVPSLCPCPLWISDTPVQGLSLLPQLSGYSLLMRDKLKITKLFLFSCWLTPLNPTHELILPFPQVQQQAQGDVPGKHPLSTGFCFKM